MSIDKYDWYRPSAEIVAVIDAAKARQAEQYAAVKELCDELGAVNAWGSHGWIKGLEFPDGGCPTGWRKVDSIHRSGRFVPVFMPKRTSAERRALYERIKDTAMGVDSIVRGALGEECIISNDPYLKKVWFASPAVYHGFVGIPKGYDRKLLAVPESGLTPVRASEVMAAAEDAEQNAA